MESELYRIDGIVEYAISAMIKNRQIFIQYAKQFCIAPDASDINYILATRLENLARKNGNELLSQKLRQHVELMELSSCYANRSNYQRSIVYKGLWMFYELTDRSKIGIVFSKSVPIEINEKYANIIRPEQIRHSMAKSFRLIEFTDEKPCGVFAKSRGDQLQWIFDDFSGEVYIQEDDDPFEYNKFIVASSLPEFLTRVEIETNILVALSSGKHTDCLTFDEFQYLNSYKPLQP